MILLLYFCTFPLLYFCTFVPLYFCTFALLHFCTSVLLYFTPADQVSKGGHTFLKHGDGAFCVSYNNCCFYESHQLSRLHTRHAGDICTDQSFLRFCYLFVGGQIFLWAMILVLNSFLEDISDSTCRIFLVFASLELVSENLQSSDAALWLHGASFLVKNRRVELIYDNNLSKNLSKLFRRAKIVQICEQDKDDFGAKIWRNLSNYFKMVILRIELNNPMNNRWYQSRP